MTIETPIWIPLSPRPPTASWTRNRSVKGAIASLGAVVPSLNAVVPSLKAMVPSPAKVIGVVVRIRVVGVGVVGVRSS